MAIYLRDFPLLAVSIHAPVRGAIGAGRSACRHRGFNSRTREGCDVRHWSFTAGVFVSIHAPVRGAM